MTESMGVTIRAWRQLDPRRGTKLTDARLQLHHAAQLATALGISYLPARPDDSHTNLEWIETIGALASKPAGSPPVRLAVRPHPLALLVLDVGHTVLSTYSLDGRTIDDSARWVRGQLAELGLDATRYTLARHYEIPPHPVDTGASFDAGPPASFEELASWYSDAASTLEQFASATPTASPVRCWPHHFDVATLLHVAPGKTISLGMEPGDEYWPEPYFYASMSPSPGVAAARGELGGNGLWHTRDWVGATLPASRLATTNQPAQVEEFIHTAVRESMRILLGAI